LGLSYVVAGAVGVLLIAKAAGADVHDLFIQGNILGITTRDLVILLAVAVGVLAVHLLLYKEFLFVSYDPEMAETLGFSTRRWTFMLYLTIGIMIAVAMRSAGVLLVFNFLVTPAVTGLLLGRNMRGVFVWAVVSGLVAALSGFVLSVPFDLPTGPAIIAVSGVAWRCQVMRPHCATCCAPCITAAASRCSASRPRKSRSTGTKSSSRA
jgi:ABC-type Mn2+/Zn2+ transport system permease subunit